MLVDGRRARSASRPTRSTALTFFFEPARPLAATIVDNAEGLSVAPFGQTIYAFAAVLLVSSMFLSLARLGRQAAAAQSTGCGPDVGSAGDAARCRVRRRPRESRRSWRRARPDRARAVLGGRARAVPRSAAAIVLYMLVRGPAVPDARTCSFTHPQPDLNQSKTGGFLDPLLGTLPAHGHRHRRRAAARGRRSPCGSPSTAARRARARGRVRRRGRGRHAEHRARDLRPASSSSSTSSASCRSPPRATPCSAARSSRPAR